MQTASEGVTLWASHHFWNQADKCYVLRLSRYDLVHRGNEPVRWDSGRWTPVFNSNPCIAPSQRSFPMESGGMIAQLAADELLLSVGDHAYDRTTMVQDRTSSYGKVWKINTRNGTQDIFTVGHRNPQGLTVTANGTVWSTEHGPKGGDEINLLRQGGNYGWPVKSFGTAYSKFEWRPGAATEDREDLTLPFFAWTPSIGVTNVIALAGPEFPLWQCDLLVSSLRAKSLYRLRTREDRIVNLEQIEVGRKIRQLVELPSGELVLLADTNDNGDRGQLIFLRKAPVPAGNTTEQ